jgi:signal transduction histidine kinase
MNAFADSGRSEGNPSEQAAPVPGERNYMGHVGRGLAFCKLAAEGHGGSILVESSGGRGSTFLWNCPLT